MMLAHPIFFSYYRFNWTKTIIVKLFIEKVCMAKDADSTEVIRLMALWTVSLSVNSAIWASLYKSNFTNEK